MSKWYQGRLILADRLVENGLVQVDGASFAAVYDLESEQAPSLDQGAVTKVEGYLAPGYIDVHVHGGGNADFMDGEPEAAAVITETHARHGTTGLLATTLTGPEEALLKAIRAARTAPRRGAKILGYHIEGPYINNKMKGAQDGRYVRKASIAEIDRWLTAGGTDRCWHVTIAPEIDGHHEAIRHMAARGFVVSAGHTEATYEQMRAAVAAGVSHTTHLYNAMRPLHHREPGTVGAAMTLPGITTELIADCVHIHPASLAVAVATRGADSILLITDAMEAMGMPDGEYQLGELTTFVKNGEARLPDGTLAGSVLTMATAVRNMVQRVGVSLPAAVAMASLNPARRHRIDQRKGSIAPGKDADLLILDQDLRVLTTLVEGEVVYDGR